MRFVDLFTSPVAISAFCAWVLAQIIKVPIEYLRKKTWNWALLANAGGMPSSHSSLMTAVSTSIGYYVGWGSPLFVLALSITGVVVYDATGVRWQAGLQAARINLIVKTIFEKKIWPEEDVDSLRESIGHSPGEALAGVLFGFAIATIVRLLMPPS
ncbi:MAG: divergent PAP2 family protein [Anaerolineaceae bacterium]